MSDTDSSPSDIEDSATSTTVPSIIPERSKDIYEKTYKIYLKWCEEKNVKNSTNEKALLAYFDQLSIKYKPSTLWSFYSMIRTMISTQKNIDISKYTQLLALLKQKSDGFKSKKTKVLTWENIRRFLLEADDDKFLLLKVALIMGISGACRRDELTYMTTENITVYGSNIQVTIPFSETRKSRVFFIASGDNIGINLVDIVMKYMSLRPPNAGNRFFLGYRNNKCIKAPVGINAFGKMPQTIASHLNLPDADQYTGNCFRRSSTYLLSDTGPGIPIVNSALLTFEGLNSNFVAENYIAKSSNENRNRISNDILGESSTRFLCITKQEDTHSVGEQCTDLLHPTPESSHSTEKKKLTQLEKKSNFKSSDTDDSLPSDIRDSASRAISFLIPEKSKETYEKTYKIYLNWCQENNIKHSTNEQVLLTYFDQLSCKYKPSSLWSFYSMIRTMISTHKNIDISKYKQLMALLKQKSDGFKSKKSKVLTRENIRRFLLEADDDTFLLLKVALIMGISGACRRDELTYMTTENVIWDGSNIQVTIPATKTKKSRFFFITSGDIIGVNLLNIVLKYISLRPPNAGNRFFLGYRNNKCIKAPVGINTFGKMPQTIASHLKLPDADKYTGNCFRRSSTSLLDTGPDIQTASRHEVWISNSVADGYLESSNENKNSIPYDTIGESSSSFHVLVKQEDESSSSSSNN